MTPGRSAKPSSTSIFGAGRSRSETFSAFDEVGFAVEVSTVVLLLLESVV